MAVRTKWFPPLAAAPLLLAGCGDLFLESERVPTSLLLADSLVTTVEGRAVPLSVTLLDQDGRAFRRLPEWAAPEWTVSGPALQVRDGGVVAAAPGQAHATVHVAGLSATARVRVNPSRLRLSIHAIQLTQAAQPEGGTAPVVQGRAATLRVFLQGDRESFFTPEVRVKVYHGADLVRTLTASASAIPTVVDPGKVEETWNVLVPAELMVPGLRLLVEADPQGAVPLAAGSVTTYPADGVPLAADVRAVPPFYVRVVPIRQASTGLTGAVDAQNLSEFLAPFTEMYPVQQVHGEVHAVYTTTAQPVDGDGWLAILAEMAALRIAEGALRYYYGVVRRTTGGISGIGYLSNPSAVGWDRLPEAAQTMAHELGHNFGRRHAPCGGPATLDPAFPTAGATLDVFGWDVARGQVRVPGQHWDLMSYCAPEWITWYTYKAVMEYRHVWDWRRGPPDGEPPADVVLVWGRIRDGQVVLAPAFELAARPSLPERPGPYRLEARDVSGAVLYSLSFDGTEVEDAAGGERHFAFAIPRAALGMAAVESLRLYAPGGQAVRVSRAPAAGQANVVQPGFSVQRTGARRVAVRWEADRHPMVMVRDPATGQVLSFARGGAAEVQTGAAEVELLFSDGVRTTARRVRVQ